ncbi:MAG: hypothetical protein AAGA50_24600, partial [Pseudomonadota bacterium]
MTLELTGHSSDLQRADNDTQLEKQGVSKYLAHATKFRVFMFFVCIPSIFAAIYFALIASNQYQAEARMIVRTIGVSERFDTSQTREGRPIIGGDSLTQDSYIVSNYLASLEIVSQLEKKVSLSNFFNKKEIDPLSRLSRNAPLEVLHKYWNRQVYTYVDGPSGIIVFRVKAFSPEDAIIIMNAALAEADNMIEKISQRAKEDLIQRAQHDVNKTLLDYQNSLDGLRKYQNETGVLDPVSTAKVSTKVIGKLLEEKLKLQVEFNSLKASGVTQSAKFRQLERKIEALEKQIASEQNKLAGKRNNVAQLSQNLIDFSRLET